MSVQPPTLASRLQEQVRIEFPATTSDGQGGQETTWQSLKTCFAEVVRDGQFRPLSDTHRALERFRYRVTIYPDTSITNAMRVVWQAKNLPIHHTELYATHMVLVCEEELGI